MDGPSNPANWQDDRHGERERRAAAALQTLRADRAPDRLRTRIERLRAAERPPRAARARRPLALGLAAAGLVAVVLAIALALPAGTPGAPSVGEAALLALRGAAVGPPAPDPAAPARRLERSVQEVYFPNWHRLGWQATGQRIDHIGDWKAVTVYYRRATSTIAYTILTAPALRRPAAAVHVVKGVEYDSLHLRGRLVVTWRRAGHTCVLSGNRASLRQLMALAAWDPKDPPASAY